MMLPIGEVAHIEGIKGERGGALLLHSREQAGYHPIILPLLRLVEPQFTWHICTEKGPLSYSESS